MLLSLLLKNQSTAMFGQMPPHFRLQPMLVQAYGSMMKTIFHPFQNTHNFMNF
jgi:hypothetical protein